MLSRLLRPLSGQDEPWGMTGLKAAERTSDFSTEVWKSEMAQSERLFPVLCFYIQQLIRADRTEQWARWVALRNLQILLACLGGEEYCHKQQVCTNESNIFQLRPFIFQSEAVEDARCHCQQQTLIKLHRSCGKQNSKDLLR